MKKLWMYITVIALGAFAVSCDENFEPARTFSDTDAEFDISASTNSVTITPADSLENVITFAWEDPGFAVGLEKSKFRIVAAEQGSDFSLVEFKDFPGVTSGSLLGRELNGMALRLGAQVGEPFALEIKGVASQGNNNEQIESDPIVVTVTPYGEFALATSVAALTTNAATPNADALELEWATAFNGYRGVKTYEIQHAKSGTSFANPTTIQVTGTAETFSHSELNNIALGHGITPSSGGAVDFRIRSTNESGDQAFSNTVTVTVTPYLPYNSIGLIGSASAGGWDVDTDMYRPNLSAPSEWTLTTYLNAGEVKFRASDAWTTNWGSTGYPNGTATQNGPNIPVANPGYYKINFNAATGEYTFTPVTTTVYTYISLIGEQSSWGSDIADLTMDPTNNQVWTGTVNLTAGQLKFRANHDWGTNWGTNGSATARSGWGVLDGPNMQITEAGQYFVYINVATGEYFFGKPDRATPFSDIGVIGNATPGGWDNDTNLIRNPANPYKWSGTLNLTAGEAKFRANNDWGINWGNNTFPTGVAVQNGPNIPVPADTYLITFNTATGEYSFVE